MRQADDMAQRRDLDPAWVRRALGEARHLPTVARLMQPPAKGFVKNWRVYRSRFHRPDPHWRGRALLECQCRHAGARRA
jgi:membrane-bound lytic murein transglycosylase B